MSELLLFLALLLLPNFAIPLLLQRILRRFRQSYSLLPGLCLLLCLAWLSGAVYQIVKLFRGPQGGHEPGWGGPSDEIIFLAIYFVPFWLPAFPSLGVVIYELGKKLEHRVQR